MKKSMLVAFASLCVSSAAFAAGQPQFGHFVFSCSTQKPGMEVSIVSFMDDTGHTAYGANVVEQTPAGSRLLITEEVKLRPSAPAPGATVPPLIFQGKDVAVIIQTDSSPLASYHGRVAGETTSGIRFVEELECVQK